MLLRNWAITYLKGCVPLQGLRISAYKCIHLLESSGGLVWQRNPIYCTRTRLWPEVLVYDKSNLNVKQGWVARGDAVINFE